MVPAWIVEELRRERERQEQEDRNREQPTVQIPVPEYEPVEKPRKLPDTVIVIQL